MSTASAPGAPASVSEHMIGSGVCIVAVAGRLVAGDGAESRHWMPRDLAAGTTHLVLALQDVTAIDAAGVGALLRLRGLVTARGGRLSLVAVPPRVRRMLRLTALDAVLALAPDGADHPEAPGRAASGSSFCRCA